MSVSCTSSTRTTTKADAIVIFVREDERSFKAARKQLIADIPHLQPLLDSGDFTGKKLTVATGYVGSAASSPRFILAGLGDGAVTAEDLRRAASAASRSAAGLKCDHLAFELPSVEELDTETVAHSITEGAVLTQYSYSKYKSAPKNGHLVSRFTIFCGKDDLKAVKKGSASAAGVAEGVVAARDLANAPNNEVYPQVLAKRAVALGKKHGFKVTVFDKKKITDLKMNGLLGVNQGSVRPPVFIIMEYRNGPQNQKPIVLVGKGITFDTGGISIKPAAGMADMKGDMHGAATVIGTMVAAANLGIKRNIIALVPSTENMPSGSAIVPGDVITYVNGKTAEVDNTDAEGRLILADALCYADRYKPEAVIDLATLTGAVVIALGSVTTGMMGNDDTVKAKLKAAGDRTCERVCELPLYEEYEELIASDIADIKNSGGRSAGPITAGLFLKNFVSYPWVHLDIAGTAMTTKPSHYIPRGNTGVGVRLLIDALQNW